MKSTCQPTTAYWFLEKDDMSANRNNCPTLDSIRDAAVRIAPFVHRTPIMSCQTLNDLSGGQVFFKCENLQKTGAFKARGAHNAVYSLDETTAALGVATHSSGNHGAAVALAAGSRGIPAWVVMPDNAPAVKQKAVAHYGAHIVHCKPGLSNRETALAQVVEEQGATLVHPFNDYRVIEGQGTVALEIFEQIAAPELLLAPVGGGGLISGCSIVSKALSPATKIIAAEPAQADDAYQSFKTGERVVIDSPDTIADGLRASIGPINFELIRENVDDIVRVEEVDIINAMRFIWERMKIIIEPSSAVPVAALIEGIVDIRDKTAAVILTGGNVDLDCLPWRKR